MVLSDLELKSAVGTEHSDVYFVAMFGRAADGSLLGNHNVSVFDSHEKVKAYEAASRLQRDLNMSGYKYMGISPGDAADVMHQFEKDGRVIFVGIWQAPA
jgi:hypothetical protein